MKCFEGAFKTPLAGHNISMSHAARETIRNNNKKHSLKSSGCKSSTL